MKTIYNFATAIMFCFGVPLMTAAQEQINPTKVEADKSSSTLHLKNSPARKASAKAQVLKERKMAEGVIMREISDKRGRVFRTYDFGNGNRADAFPLNRTSRAAGDYTFYESFEAWTDADGYNWIPDGWTEINTEENTPTENQLAHNLNNSWYAYWTGDGTWLPITNHGEKDMFIHFSYTFAGNDYEIQAAPQDEWLITPEVTIQTGQQVYFDLAVDAGSLAYFDWSTYKYDRSNIINNMELMVSADQGANWTCLWNCFDDWACNLSDADMLDTMGYPVYHTFASKLTEYEGKTVKFAFRYTNIGTGTSGNSMAIDGVTVGYPAAEANYNLPYGALLSGINEDFYALNWGIVLLPPYCATQWQSNCNAFTDNYEWKFYNQETGENDISYTRDTVEVSYKPGVVALPELTAENFSGSDTYAWGENDNIKPGMQIGGSPVDGEKTTYGVGNYDYLHNGIQTPAFKEGSYAFGTGSDADWDDSKVVGVGNFFEKPAAPFTVDYVYATLGALDAKPEAELDLHVLIIDSYSRATDTIAHATAKCGDAYFEDGMYSLRFNFIDKNGNKTNFTLDRDVLMEISGFAKNADVTTFAAMTQTENHANGKGYAYINFEYDYEGTLSYHRYPANEMLQNFNRSLLLTLKGEYGYLSADNTTINLSADKVSEQVKLNTCYTADKLWIETAEGKMSLNKDVALDWLTLNVAFDEWSGETLLNISAEAATQQRSMNFTLCSNAGKVDFTVNQDVTSAIGIIENISATSINHQNGLLSVTDTANAGASVMIYNASGQIVATLALNNEGKAAMSTETLPTGVYIVKSGSNTHKFVK